jgi:peptidyl-prolyl cis-trans isomerase B (cyclophilin B)
MWHGMHHEGRLRGVLAFLVLLGLVAAFGDGRLFSCYAQTENGGAEKPMSNPIVEIETSEGKIQVELFADKAPKTVENFLQYVDDGFYKDTIFHRVISNFMIQGGGFTEDMQQKKTRAPVQNEARTDVKNLRGTLAMARTNDLHSATAQFFINVNDNVSLDHRDETSRGFGYAVFGKVIGGMDVVDKIKSVKTTNVGPYGDVPASPVKILGVTRVQKGE